MSQQYDNGSYVVYGKMGVCRVVEQKLMKIGDETGEYYVLCPISDSRSSVYVPCDNPQLVGRLRPLLTREEIEVMLAGVDERIIEWIDDRNLRLQEFKGIQTAGNRQELLRLIRCLYKKKQEKTAAGKHLSSMDEMILGECIRLVEEEFALALGISRSEVATYIRERLDE